MIITELKKIGTGKRFDLFVDNNKICGLEAEIIVKNALSVGSEIDWQQLEDIKLQNSNLTCFEKALSVLDKVMKSEKGLKDTLYQKGFHKTSIENAICKLKEYGYINDEIYCENFIRTYQNSKGKKKLKFELQTKGIKSEIIENKLDEILNDDDQNEVCYNLLQKFMNNRAYDQKNKQKAFNHLISKGFDYSAIKIAFEKKEKNCESWD